MLHVSLVPFVFHANKTQEQSPYPHFSFVLFKLLVGASGMLHFGYVAHISKAILRLHYIYM